MAGQETILQHWVLTQFVYPFILIFAIVFGVLEKTNLFGKEKKQLNAIVAFAVGIIFVAAVSPKLMVGNLMLFLSVALVIVLVVLMIFGFITGSTDVKFEGKGVKVAAGIIIILAVTIFLFITTGIWDNVINTLFKQSWSESVWTNVIFIFIIAAVLALVLSSSKKS
jgi:hypothetical protein